MSDVSRLAEQLAEHFAGHHTTPEELVVPALPLRGMVLFPNAVMPLSVARPASLAALESLGADNLLAVVAQRDPLNENPSVDDLYRVGTLAVVLRTARLSQSETTTVAFVQGLHRVSVIEQVNAFPFLSLRVRRMRDVVELSCDAEFEALRQNVRDSFAELVQESPKLPDDLLMVSGGLEDASTLCDFIASSLPSTGLEARQLLLEEIDVRRRLTRLLEQILREREDQRLRNKIRADVAEKIDARQKEMLLREQLRSIQAELGDEDDASREARELRTQLDQANLPDEVRKEADQQLGRIERLGPGAPDYAVVRNYLDTITALPWRNSTAMPISVDNAAQILDADHYGLEKIKERILEFIAVYQLKRDLKGPILCFVGPPGVGKTSLGRSIAHATGRNFVRISLGGLHDEAEIRGHRRTYIGALPGQILRGLRRAGSNDPVFMLDEVDKIGRDFRGDPAAALLEVLDPEQNYTFRDNYVDLPFDLSHVLFITTANVTDSIPPALLDRMEILHLAGYIEEEKIHIARRYLIPRQLTANGLHPEQLEFPDAALETLIHGYTQEAGVRSLEQQIAAVCRKRARQVAGNGHDLLTITPQLVHDLLGSPSHLRERELSERTRHPGVAIALAWTPSGGDILFVEVARLPRDKGDFIITGQVREVMQESARAAWSWVRRVAPRFGIDSAIFRESELHLHIPAGSIPKDGPSCGLVLATAILSSFLERPLRPYVAMTGEITLSGDVLPVGGVKEKVLAAKRSGVREIVLPTENRAKLFEDVPEHLRTGLTFHFVDHIEDAVCLALGLSGDGLRQRAVDSHPTSPPP